MLGKKGQSALEYLMTYGWAILIIIIVGGVLYYYGVFSPGRLVGESKIGFSKVYVDTWGISGNNLNFILENRAGKDIEINRVYIQGKNCSYSGTMVFNAGQKSSSWESVDMIDCLNSTLTTDDVDVPSSGEVYQFDVAIEYSYSDLGSTLFNSSGTISGTA